MLEISHQLNQRAAGLSADAKQKISLGRGLVREDVSAVLFDEPLTVIDPHLKWQLRRKLKQIHHELKLTLIYVTHDQIEALTFAQEIVVMTRGRAVQIGSADELFERPRHVFVGNFIGSPGMNFLPVCCEGKQIMLGAHALEMPAQAKELQLASLRDFVLGVRPEYVELAQPQQEGAIPVRVIRAQDVGTHWVLTATIDPISQTEPIIIRARLPAQTFVPAVGTSAWFKIMSPHTRFYKNEEMIA
jgi:glycerol transport system ATP-binding protein